MVDWYFKRAITVDYLVSISASLIAFFLHHKYHFSFPKTDVLLTITSDLSTIALTFAGFILTLLTILITFKTGTERPTDENQHEIPLFELFFHTPLYTKTISLLKNAIKSLIIIAMVGYIAKLALRENTLTLLFFYDISAVCLITMTLWRNLTILGLILALQRNQKN